MRRENIFRILKVNCTTVAPFKNIDEINKKRFENQTTRHIKQKQSTSYIFRLDVWKLIAQQLFRSKIKLSKKNSQLSRFLNQHQFCMHRTGVSETWFCKISDHAMWKNIKKNINSFRKSICFIRSSQLVL